MENYASYNSSYPLDYYEVGTVYAFYGRVGVSADVADEEYVAQYAHCLRAINVEDMESGVANALQPVVRNRPGVKISVNSNELIRFYAVVVDKEYAGGKAYIVVMFCSKDNGQREYYTKSYAVSYGCETDGKNLMPVKDSFSIKSKVRKKAGNITKAESSKKVGSVTKAVKKQIKSSSVGQVTQMPKVEAEPVKKVGGITLAKKVGGITLLRR